MATTDLTNVSALSVDLFDTLLLRAVADPADVFERVGALASNRGHLRRHVTPGQFDAIRRGAEDAARLRKRAVSGSTEVTLTEIYAAMPDGVLKVSVETLAATEVEVEQELVFPHPGSVDMVLAARAKGLRIAILSDTCFSAAQIRLLLTAAGLDPTLFDEILTSSDHGVSKRDGGLFGRLLARWPDLTAGQILHVGDHPHADVTQARAAGLRAFGHETGDATTRDALRLELLRYGHQAPEITSLRRLAVSLVPPIQDDERWWFALGASILGPLFTGLADWVVDACIQDDINVIRPLMREGALLARMISRSADASGVDLDVRPLYVSRASTWLASIRAFDTSSARHLLQRQQLTVAEALATLGLHIDRAPQALRDAAGVRIEVAGQTETASINTLEDELLAYLSRADVRVEVDYHAARARRLVNQYLDQECGDAAHVALVDVGFRGSIGLALERATANVDRRFHQFLLFGADGIQRLWTSGHDVRVYGAGPADNADFAGVIARHPAVLEAVLMEGGSTLGYRRKGDRVVPVLDDSLVPDDQQAAVAACRRGIEAFQERWLDWRLLRAHAARAVVASPLSLVEPLHRLLTMPTFEEASRLGALLHEDNDGGASTRVIADPALVTSDLTAAQFMEAGLVASLVSAPLWPAGMWEQRWPGALERQWRQAAGLIDGAPPAIPAVAMKVREAGVRRCVVWGAGEAGAALVKACRSEGIDVQAVTDSNPALWGSAVEGVPVVSPDEVREQGADVYAIGSLAFASDIERALTRGYAGAARRVRIFRATSEEAA